MGRDLSLRTFLKWSKEFFRFFLEKIVGFIPPLYYFVSDLIGQMIKGIDYPLYGDHKTQNLV